MDTSVSLDRNAPVYIAPCDDYDSAVLIPAVQNALEALGITEAQLAGKKVAVKPNLVMKKGPEAAVTTHPLVLDALLAFLDRCGCADVVIAESPGGPYTEASITASYQACGIAEIAGRHHARLNTDLSAKPLSAPDGERCKGFDIITPIADAEVIFNLCKLKSHSLTRMSGAVKNTFGTIPGLTKFEFHARFDDYDAFNGMLVDLSAMLHTHALMIDLCDAVIGMEGNGPTGGNPRKIGALLVSRNPFSLDRIGSALLACPHEVPMIENAARRGFCPEEPEDVPTLGGDWKSLVVTDFVPPDSSDRKNALSWLPHLFGGSVYRWFQPRPVVRVSTCVGCGECVRSCPMHTIELVKIKGKRKAQIHPEHCIRCFCCQELCPIHSVDIRRNPLLYLISKMR